MGADRLKTELQVICRGCGKRAYVKTYLPTRKDENGFVMPLRLRCSRCGHGDPIIVGREPLRSWSKRRFGR
jgi:ribosomal protein L37E